MYKGRFRLLIHPQMDGRMNMAIDEALMVTGTHIGVTPVLRLYGFSPATLSLGRFQRIKGRIKRDIIKKEGIVVVRRPTGGQAVLHDHEITYSVTLSRDYIQPFKKRVLYESIGELFMHALHDYGLSCYLNKSRRGELRNPDCFQTSGEYEILSSGGKKLIGSAQVTNRTSVLQHGSIPLNGSHRQLSRFLDHPIHTEIPLSTSIEEETGLLISFQEMEERLADSLKKYMQCEVSELTEEETALVKKLHQHKYMKETWNCMY